MPKRGLSTTTGIGLSKMGKVLLNSFIHFLIVIIEIAFIKITIEIVVKLIYTSRYHKFIDEKAKEMNEKGKILKDRPVKKVSYTAEGVTVVTKKERTTMK